MCTETFIAPLFIIIERWNQPKCPSVDKQANKTQCSYTMEYYSATKRSEILTHATTRMRLENSIVRKRGKSQKITDDMTPFPQIPQ